MKRRITIFIKMMKDKIRSNDRQCLEILLLALGVIFYCCFDVWGFLIQQMDDASLIEKTIIYILFNAGPWISGILLLLAGCMMLRRCNKDYIMNTADAYHDYPYWWYWLCAKVLGINRCSLIRVPIHMQFKLILNATFSQYTPEKDSFSEIENEGGATIGGIGEAKPNDNVVLILEDTYLIDEKRQLPEKVSGYPFLKVSRYRRIATDHNRYCSRIFADTVHNEVEKLPENITIHLFSTLNPCNLEQIASDVFKRGGRSNVQHLIVYQQSKDDDRHFEDKGYKIF